MDYSDMKAIAREVVWDNLEDTLTDKKCPKCKADCTMVRVSVMPEEGEEGYAMKWRCLNCLGMFVEELNEVKKGGV